MRRGVIWVAGVTVGAVVIVFAYLSYSSGSLVRDGQTYAEDAIVDITSTWSTPAFLDRISPALEKHATVPEIDAMFDLLARLGKRFNSGPCKGSVTTSLGLGGAQVTASYRCLASFEKGTAIITIELVRDGPSWLINSFAVESPILTKIKVRSSVD